ncbi:MAG TPA: TonB-dependent receptor [Phenylobacterium sp.]|nr:TonB-dependent receptor [Phenylobacterium sp.]
MPRFVPTTAPLPFALALFAGTSALAQTAQTSAVATAADAFGERVGIEQLGLYSEGQVRGFDLQASGAYRINDAYFARAAPLNDPVLAGVSVRVGVNAARLAYPSPSGVVNYRLREPTPENQLTLGGGMRDYGTPVIEGAGSWTSQDGAWSVTGGTVLRPRSRWGIGSEGEAFDGGLVARWRPAEGHTLTAFATTYLRQYNGDTGFIAAERALPPPPRKLHHYVPDWSEFEGANNNLGLLYDGTLAGWSLNLSAFRSAYEVQRADFTLIAVEADGDAKATLFRNPRRENVSWSTEARLARVFATGEFSHLLGASVRARRSTVDLASSQAVPLTPFNLADDMPNTAEPPGWSGTRGQDRVEQVTGSLNYGLLWGERLQLRLGAHRTRYDKTVDSVKGVRTEGVDSTWLYNASAVWSLSPRTSLFASWVTGLEETGVAPQTATNRDEVLSPVEAEQREFGVRHGLTDRLTLIGAVFDVSKPTMGLRPDGSFGLVGEISHRGVEGSLAGTIGERTRVVLGAVKYKPEVTGVLVDTGQISATPAGLSSLIANASVEQEIGSGWSLDGQVSYNSARWVDPQNTLRAPAITTLNLGARRRFVLDGRPAQFRVLVSNVTDEEGWFGSPSTQLWPISPRSVRASFSVTFG